jgi:hypothetical protein
VKVGNLVRHRHSAPLIGGDLTGVIVGIVSTPYQSHRDPRIVLWSDGRIRKIPPALLEVINAA